jgi:hypothetical protein
MSLADRVLAQRSNLFEFCEIALGKNPHNDVYNFLATVIYYNLTLTLNRIYLN